MSVVKATAKDTTTIEFGDISRLGGQRKDNNEFLITIQATKRHEFFCSSQPERLIIELDYFLKKLSEDKVRPEYSMKHQFDLLEEEACVTVDVTFFDNII